ncbi:diguanylate cyclase [Mesobacillus subterraneus]|uniref:sensor domain-containing diguanylate cyclase n=1 Tax=Mesobacillus subterraneus TaxID=285983 RepID=UPI0020415453|nr:diguanylate cyclase [Mesobacillus subterraneus]MCM3666240.1 diguanylate cyclase [Mesobacillus subterraneus]MCM3685239.1 diguanylate cyclase [Mesobacillus subterraneus]
MKINLRAYMALFFGIMIIALTMLLSITISKQSGDTIKREIGNSLSTTAYHMADKLDSFMWSRVGEVEVLSQIGDIHSPHDITAAQSLLDQLKASIPVFSWIGLTNADGTVIAASDKILVGSDISKRPVYQEGKNGTFIGDVHNAVLLANLLPNPSGEPMQFVDISKALTDEKGNFTGVLAAHLSWEWSRQVQDEIVEPLKDELSGAEVFVVSKTDNTVLLGPGEMTGTVLELNSVHNARKGENSWLVEKWPDGKRYLTGFAVGDGHHDYSGLGWTVIVRIPEENAFAPVENLKSYIIKLGTITAVTFAIIGWLLAGFITNPLRKISKAAHSLRLGKETPIPFIKGIKDLELLSGSLRDLVDSLVRTESNLGKMENLAHHDLLTGLGNRVALDQFIKQARTDSNSLSFLYLDLDGFKKINDSYGHHIGDLLLQGVACRLKEITREKDTIFRLGGDEFLVVVETPSESVEHVLASVANKLITHINKPYDIADAKLQVGCSIGGAVWPDHDIDPFTVISYADDALYVSKRAGKNKFTFHSKKQINEMPGA